MGTEQKKKARPTTRERVSFQKQAMKDRLPKVLFDFFLKA
jgi:hypothetical protein